MSGLQVEGEKCHNLLQLRLLRSWARPFPEGGWLRKPGMRKSGVEKNSIDYQSLILICTQIMPRFILAPVILHVIYTFWTSNSSRKILRFVSCFAFLFGEGIFRWPQWSGIFLLWKTWEVLNGDSVQELFGTRSLAVKRGAVSWCFNVSLLE